MVTSLYDIRLLKSQERRANRKNCRVLAVSMLPYIKVLNYNFCFSTINNVITSNKPTDNHECFHLYMETSYGQSHMRVSDEISQFMR